MKTKKKREHDNHKKDVSQCLECPQKCGQTIWEWIVVGSPALNLIIHRLELGLCTPKVSTAMETFRDGAQFHDAKKCNINRIFKLYYLWVCNIM